MTVSVTCSSSSTAGGRFARTTRRSRLQITQITARGLGYGVHVVLSVQRWMEMRPALRDLISNRLELRLGDPSESEFDRKIAVNVPEGNPGRGLSPFKLHFLSALPRIDGTPVVDDLVDGVADLVTRIDSAWNGPSAPEVRLLPKELPYAQLPAIAETGAALPIGVDEDTLSPVSIDLDAEPHFIVIGDVESGKSNLLRIDRAGHHDPVERRTMRRSSPSTTAAACWARSRPRTRSVT